MGWNVNVTWHMQTMNGTQTLAHIHINVHWHLQTKSGVHVLAHIQAEQGMGWGGVGRSLTLANPEWHTKIGTHTR